MKNYVCWLVVLMQLPLLSLAQGNVGIGGPATRAKLEVYGIAGAGKTNAVFGSNGSGISFQQNWPSVGFNQYRNAAGGNGTYMGTGYAAVEYLDPSTGVFALDMSNVSGFKDNNIASELYRAFTIFPTGAVSFGKGNYNTNFNVDYLNYNNTNVANGSIYFYGTQYPSFINATNIPGIPTQIGPGKDYGYLYINDLPGQNVVIGGGGTKVGINTAPFYLTTLSIRHPTDGRGLLLIEENSYNNWEWYVSADNPVWIGQKYNGNLIGDYNPTTGQHGYLSDRRLKTNIRPLPPLLDKVMQLQPVQYKMKNADDDSKINRGFIAQEVRKLFPELVAILNDNNAGDKALPDLHMLNYSQFFVIAIKAIQEQQAQIATLTKEIIKLEQTNQ
ncbi:MAG: tail fiber domain-containing protein [Bacteroidota bacterium]